MVMHLTRIFIRYIIIELNKILLCLKKKTYKKSVKKWER